MFQARAGCSSSYVNGNVAQMTTSALSSLVSAAVLVITVSVYYCINAICCSIVSKSTAIY